MFLTTQFSSFAVSAQFRTGTGLCRTETGEALGVGVLGFFSRGAVFGRDTGLRRKRRGGNIRTFSFDLKERWAVPEHVVLFT